MNILRLTPNTFSEPFKFSFFHDVIPSDIFERCRQEAQRYPYFRVEKTRTSNPNRIWASQNPGWLSAIGMEFDSVEVKREIAYALETPRSFVKMGTRVELCMDSVGSWLEPHQDDPAKAMTLQLYLDGNGISTSLGDISTDVKPNMAWAFDNQNTPVHSLPPLKYNRVSIIVNYVDDSWRDRSVLV